MRILLLNVNAIIITPFSTVEPNAMRSLRRDWCHRPTHRKVWSLAVPMTVSNLSVPLVSLTNTTVAGHLSYPAQLAAVEMGVAVYALPVSVLSFLRLGTTSFAAQATGRGDGTALRHILLQGMILALAFSLAMMLVGSPLLVPLLHLIKPTSRLGELVIPYLHLRFLGLPAAIFNYVLTGWYLGTHQATKALRVTLVTNLVNIVLNLFLALVLGSGTTASRWPQSLANGLGCWWDYMHCAGCWAVIRDNGY